MTTDYRLIIRIDMGNRYPCFGILSFFAKFNWLIKFPIDIDRVL